MSVSFLEGIMMAACLQPASWGSGTGTRPRLWLLRRQAPAAGKASWRPSASRPRTCAIAEEEAADGPEDHHPAHFREDWSHGAVAGAAASLGQQLLPRMSLFCGPVAVGGLRAAWVHAW